MIVVTGATGNVGTELVRLLSEAGKRVKAVSRRPPKAEPLPGVEWVTADLAQRETLHDAFAGAERLFLATGNIKAMVRAHKNGIAVAEEVGIRQVVKVSALGASDHSASVIGMWHYVTEQTLRHTQLEWTILRPHVFMQNVLNQTGSIQKESVIRSPSANAAVPMIDTRDIAAVAAAVLTGDGHAGARYTLTGPSPVSWEEIAGILSEILERPISYVAESEDDAWHRMRGAGAPPWLIGAQLTLAEYQRQGGGTDIVTNTVAEIAGRPPRTFRQFALDHAKALQSGSLSASR